MAQSVVDATDFRSQESSGPSPGRLQCEVKMAEKSELNKPPRVTAVR